LIDNNMDWFEIISPVCLVILLSAMFWHKRHWFFYIEPVYRHEDYENATEKQDTKVWLAYIYNYGLSRAVFLERWKKANNIGSDDNFQTIGDELDNIIERQKIRARETEVLEAIDYLNNIYMDIRTLSFGAWLQKNGLKWLRREVKKGQNFPIKFTHTLNYRKNIKFQRGRRTRWEEFPHYHNEAFYIAMSLLDLVGDDFDEKFAQWLKDETNFCNSNVSLSRNVASLNKSEYLTDCFQKNDFLLADFISELNTEGIDFRIVGTTWHFVRI